MEKSTEVAIIVTAVAIAVIIAVVTISINTPPPPTVRVNAVDCSENTWPYTIANPHPGVVCSVNNIDTTGIELSEAAAHNVTIGHCYNTTTWEEVPCV